MGDACKNAILASLHVASICISLPIDCDMTDTMFLQFGGAI
jgi:hypothetical protein